MYQCQHKETLEVFACKVINLLQLTENESEYLREEIQIERLMSHNYVVQMVEVYKNEKQMHIVMEQVGGGDLLNYIQSKPEINEAELSLIMRQLIEAIAYLEKSGIVHRDLKPENIMIETDLLNSEIHQIKITDFGLSKINIPNEQMTESCGTPAYVAPEILMKQGYNQKVDIWAAGIIFYYLIRKQLPFKASDRMKTFEPILNKNPDLNHPAFKNVHPEVIDVIMKMLDKNP